MPIDPNIVLGLKPAPDIDPLTIMGKSAQYRNLISEQQFNQEKLKQAQLTTAKTVRAQQDEENVRQAFLQSNGDPQETLKLAIKNGAGPDAVTGLQKHFADLAKTTAEIDSQRLPVEIQKNSNLLELHDQYLAMSPQQQAQAWPQVYARAVQLDPETAKHFTPDAPPDPTQVQLSRALHMTKDYELKQTAEKRAQEEAAQKATAAGDVHAKEVAQLPATQAKAKTDTLIAEKTATNPALLTPEQQQQANQATTTEKETARHNAELERQGILRVNVDTARLKLEREKAGFEMGGGVSETAKMAAAGQMDPQTLRATLRRSPGLLNQIRQVDPNFDEADIDKRYNTLKEFTSSSTGKAGGQAIALNTLIHHADLYLDVADALKNGTFTPGNAIYNRVASLFGSAPPQNAALVGRFLAGETGKVATGGVPAEGEINGILSSLGTNASPEQIKGAATSLLQIAAGRATPLMEKVHDAKLDNVVHVIGPDAKAILSKRGFNPDTMKPTQADTSTGKYKAGDTRQVNGVTYVRDDKGIWNPK